MARFYAIRIQPSLFGEGSSRREWGRDRLPRSEVITATFLSETETTKVLTYQTTAKLPCGYSEYFRKD